MTRMKTMLVLVERPSHVTRRYLEGVNRYARENDVRVHVVDLAQVRRPIADLIRFRAPDGVLLYSGRTGNRTQLNRLPAGVPVVGLDRNFTDRGIPCLCNDSAAVGRLAARELLKLNCAAYGYVGWEKPTDWSEERGQSFIREIVECGSSARQFKGTWSEGDLPAAGAAFMKFLDRLPKPCGIFAANDATADVLMSACRAANVRIPDDVAVVSVDNDAEICENTYVSLTSIEPDFPGIGYACAKLLGQVVRGRRKTPVNALTMIPPVGIVRRASSRLVTSGNTRVITALETIRKHASEGIGVAEIAAAAGLSRRMLEIAFRKATGKTVLQELTDVRLERVCQLLKDTHYTLGEIPALCGWKSENFLKRLFKAHFGMTMSAWRRSVK